MRPDQVDVWVLDRRHKDCDGCLFILRRALTNELDKGIAKWITSSERGRFLILPINTSSGESAEFTDSEDELIELLRVMGDGVFQSFGRNLELGILVAPDLEARLRSLIAHRSTETPVQAQAPSATALTEIVASDPRVRDALGELTDVMRWINERYKIQLPGEVRPRMANGCFDLVLEHQAAIQLLTKYELYGSMLALVRIVFEAFVRGCWLARCATDEQLEHFRAHDDLGKKSFETLVVEVEHALGNTLGTLQTLKKNAWGMMNSFTHTGMHQITRRNSETSTGANYSVDDVVTGVRLAGILGLLSAIEMATIAGNEALALATLERARQYGADYEPRS